MLDRTWLLVPAFLFLLEACGGGPAAKPAHHDFMGACANKPVRSPEWCTCSMDEAKKGLDEAKKGLQDAPPGPDNKMLFETVIGMCMGNSPEETFKESFTKKCIGTLPEKKTSCECRWTELRKQFSPPDLIDDSVLASDRFRSALAPAASRCGER